MLTETRPRRCALAGCDKPLRYVEGRPEPTYCSAAHRARAREERRAERLNAQDGYPPYGNGPYGNGAADHGARGDGGNGAGGAAGYDVPWQLEPQRSRIGARISGALNLDAQRRRQRARVRRDVRQRTLAVLGAAGMLAAGSVVVVSSSSEQGAQLALAQLAPSAFSMERGREWASQANVKLASLTSQLAELKAVQQEWASSPLALVGPKPSAVLELERRIELVTWQQGAVSSQLAAWEALQRVQGDVAAAEAKLVRAERNLDQIASSTRLNREGAVTQDQLAVVRDLSLRQRDAKKSEQVGLERGVAAAVDNPMPDLPERTKAVTKAVRDLTDKPQRPPADQEHHQLPALAARGGEGNRTTDQVDTGAPPNPRSAPGDDPVGTAVRGVSSDPPSRSSRESTDESSDASSAEPAPTRSASATPRSAPRRTTPTSLAARSLYNPFAPVSGGTPRAAGTRSGSSSTSSSSSSGSSSGSSDSSAGTSAGGGTSAGSPPGSQTRPQAGT